jgi:hypothetical protein
MALLGVFLGLFLKAMCHDHHFGAIEKSNKPKNVQASGSSNFLEILGVLRSTFSKCLQFIVVVNRDYR